MAVLAMPSSFSLHSECTQVSSKAHGTCMTYLLATSSVSAPISLFSSSHEPLFSGVNTASYPRAFALTLMSSHCAQGSEKAPGSYECSQNLC